MAIARQRIHLPPGTWSGLVAAWRRGELWEGGAIARFERTFADAIGVREAVAVPSGRAGLLFVLRSLGLEPGSEVLCSAFGYPVVPYIVREEGYRLGLVDCELGTFGMDPDALAETIGERTRAVIVTHLYGVPCRVRELRRITEAHGAVLIEDCAHSAGASVAGRATGSIGRAGYFSFETSKILNTMGGGMVTTDDVELAARVREHARAQPAKDERWLRRRLARTTFEAVVTHPLGFNAAVYPALRLAADERFASGYAPDMLTLDGRMGRYTAYQAEIGLRQLARIQAEARMRRENAEYLISLLDRRVHFQKPDADDVVPNHMLVAARFAALELAATALLARGVDTKRGYMRDCSALLPEPREHPNAARLERQVLYLPAYADLSRAQLDRVAAAVEEVLEVEGGASSALLSQVGGSAPRAGVGE